MKFIFMKCGFPKTLLRNRFCLLILKCNLKSWSIVFFGSDSFSATNLKKLFRQKALFNNIEVVTVNNCNPVYNFAISNNIGVQEWPPMLIGPHDFGVVVSFGKLIPKNVIEHFPLGIINVHPSLLPQWRGAMPIVHSLKNGDTITGITIIRIKHDKFDTGDIIMRKSCPIGNNELLPSLCKRLSEFGSECLLEVINNMPECLNGAVSQSNENVTYAKKLTKNASFINWNVMAAREIYNLYRALFGLFELETTWKGRRVNLVCISLNEVDERFPSELKEIIAPGRVRYRAREKCLIVQCKDKSIRICTLRLNGKLYSAFHFYQGFLSQTSKDCWTFGD